MENSLLILEELGLEQPAEKLAYWRPMGRKEELFAVRRKYPYIPQSIVLKADLLRRGVIFTKRAAEELQKECYEHHPSKLFQFHKIDNVSYKFPLDFAFNDGTRWCIRVSPPEMDPYTVDFIDETFWLKSDDEILEELNTAPRPPYYDKVTSSGVPMRYVGMVKPSDAVIFIPLSHCHYWNSGDQCRFCDMDYNMKLQMKLVGRDFKVRCSPEDLYETTKAILDEEGRWRHLCITGGSDPRDGYKREFEYYLACTKAIQRAFKEFCGEDRVPLYLILTPYTKEQMKRLYGAGATRFASNLEIWDPEKFALQCPGKEKGMGRDEWIRRTIDAVEVFGEGNVESALVTGAMMAPPPYGFEEIDEALASELEGYKFFLDHSVIPINYILTLEPGSYFYRIGMMHAPLEFHVRVDVARYRLLKDYLKNNGQLPFGATDYRCCPHGACYEWDRLL